MRALAVVGRMTMLVALFAMWGCGSSMPKWISQPPEDPDRMYAVASMTSRDMQMAKQKAMVAARADIAQQLESKLGNVTKLFQEDTALDAESEAMQHFVSATKTVSKTTLVGSKMINLHQEKEKNIWRVYVLVSVPIGEANRLLKEQIDNDKIMYQQFKASKAYKDLEKDLENYDKM